MIKIKNTDVYGWDAAIRGMRNPYNSWDKSDTSFGLGEDFYNDMKIGRNDLSLMNALVRSGSDHSKFLRMINVTCDITAPLYWWKEFDTYKVGTVANSCSTMHKIAAKEFTFDDFSIEHVIKGTTNCDPAYYNAFEGILFALNEARHCFLDTKDKTYWWQMIQLLPSSYNQKRTVQLNYQVLLNMYCARKDHKLDEWVDFCNWVRELQYFEKICLEESR